MIAFIKGRIIEKGLGYLLVENQGLGYKVFVTPDALDNPIGSEVRFFTYHKVSEDGQALFGLPDFDALKFFELLITVSGVGPKAALSILSSAPVESVKQAIASQDAGAFKRISGIGTKTAEKIIVELKNKIVASSSVEQYGGSDVFDALSALGYGQKEVREVINKLDSRKTEAEQLKQALQMLGKK